MGLFASRRVGSSHTRALTCVPCVSRWIRNFWTTGEVTFPVLLRYDWQSQFHFLFSVHTCVCVCVCVCYWDIIDIWLWASLICIACWLEIFIYMLTLKKCGFELYGPAYLWIFFSSLSYYMICGWLNLLMWNCRFEGPTVKFYAAFRLIGSVPVIPAFFRGLLYSSRITTEVLAGTSLRSRNYRFFFVMRTSKTQSLGNFETYNTVSLAVITILCIRFPELIPFICKFIIPFSWKSCLTTSQFSYPVVTSNHKFGFFRVHM